MTNQTVTSACISINSHRLPAICRRIASLLQPGTIIFDYGCGRYVDHVRDFFAGYGCQYIGYDPYNRTDTDNLDALMTWQHTDHSRCIGICSNVLNVIDSDDVVRDVIVNLQGFARTCYYTVYEGDKSGTGRYPTSDSYQRNASLKSYAAYVPDGYKVRFFRGVMEVTQ